MKQFHYRRIVFSTLTNYDYVENKLTIFAIHKESSGIKHSY